MAEGWEALEAKCKECKKCRLCEGRRNVVFGVGDKNAKIMFVGEGPGEDEDREGEPFVGKSGQLLDKYLNFFGFDRRDNVYIANIVKCRPPKNRDPLEDEAEICIEYLRQQVRLIRPQIIVCLGRVAAIRLIKEDFRVTKEHGEFFEKKGVYMVGTFHPSALLRTPSNKIKAFEDFQKIRDKAKELGIV